MKNSKYISFNNNNDNSNELNYIHNIISNNLLNKYPWMSEKKEEDNIEDILNTLFGIEKPKPTKKIKKTVITITKQSKPNHNQFDLADILSYLNDETKDTYDYKLFDGTPVKNYGDRIQIGYDMIPLFNTNSYYNSLNYGIKKQLTDIFIYLNK